MPGDRLYFGDVNADSLVANAQKMDYQPDIDNVPAFPIVTMQDLIDSRNVEYILGTDFCITSDGNITWLAGGKNPGIDPSTGKGRVYSVRYLYKAFYYVVSLPKEVRVTNVTTAGVRSPERMPMYAVIMREYLFHNANRGDQKNQNVSKTPQRVDAAPEESTNPNKNQIPVDMSSITDKDED
jgi:hypothetical protein